MQFKAAFAISIAVMASALHAQQRGVSSGEIVLGTIQDLSGPLSTYGRQIRDGLQLRVDQINERGGIHGRRLRLVVEDSGG